MDMSRDKAPTAQETFLQMAQAAGLRGRLLVTIGLLLLVRLGVYLPVPGINREAFQARIGDQALTGFLDLF
ncbi:MAG: preprotein translocase subunit SecY, partial [Trichodesmium sp. St11_bin5]|nr:preprotein translocase subunit SecY [Trichodesmium sp. St11_bin5]